jgi:hypothetical protein
MYQSREDPSLSSIAKPNPLTCNSAISESGPRYCKEPQGKSCKERYRAMRITEVPNKKGRPPTTVDLVKLRGLLNVPLPSAAMELGISLTTLKQVCRKIGIKRWPYRRPGRPQVAVSGAQDLRLTAIGQDPTAWRLPPCTAASQSRLDAVQPSYHLDALHLDGARMLPGVLHGVSFDSTGNNIVSSEMAQQGQLNDPRHYVESNVASSDESDHGSQECIDTALDEQGDCNDAESFPEMREHLLAPRADHRWLEHHASEALSQI